MVVKLLKEDYKKIIFAFLTTLIVHFIKLVNYFPTWDSLGDGVDLPWKGMTNHGRWFSGILKRLLASQYDLQWVEGIISAVFIALTIVLILRIFDVKNKVCQILAIVTFVTFPSVTSTFAYMFWTPAYMCALFMGVLGVYLCINCKAKVAIPVAMLLFTLCIATYQVYIPFSVTLFAFYIATKLWDSENKLRDYKGPIISAVIALVGCAVIYYVGGKLAVSFFNVELTSYQGASTVGLMSVSQYIIAAKTSFMAFVNYFLTLPKVGFYGAINAVIIGFIIAFAIKFILLKKDIKVIRRICILLLYSVLVPLTYFFYFASPDVFYHRLMELGNYFVYLFVIIILNRYYDEMKQFFRRALICVIALLCFYNFINANIAYQSMHMSYERTYFELSEIMMKVDELKTEDVPTVALVGEFEEGDNAVVASPYITGAAIDNFVQFPMCAKNFSKYYLDRDIVLATDEQIEKIEATEAFEQMPTYPQNGSIAVIDGIIVVKLS